MQRNVQREVTVSKFRPGLTIKDFNFIQCLAFQDVWVVLWDIFSLLLHQKRIKAWEMEFKKKKRRGVNLRITGTLSNVTINDVNMSCLQGQYQCFWCLVCASVSSAGTDAQKRLSSPLKCCPCYFCIVFRQKGSRDVVFSRYRLSEVWQKWQLRVSTASR